MDKELRRAIYDKYDGHCAYCGNKITYGQLQADHIHPRSKGGVWNYDNFNPSCASCNHFKANMTIEEMRLAIKNAVCSERRYKSSSRLVSRYPRKEIALEDIKFYFETVEAKEYSSEEE